MSEDIAVQEGQGTRSLRPACRGKVFALPKHGEEGLDFPGAQLPRVAHAMPADEKFHPINNSLLCLEAAVAMCQGLSDLVQKAGHVTGGSATNGRETGLKWQHALGGNIHDLVTFWSDRSAQYGYLFSTVIEYSIASCRLHVKCLRGPGPAGLHFEANNPVTPMKIDFISDVACPWCAVGLNALEIALKRLGPDYSFTLHMRPYELNPDMGPDGMDATEYLGRKYGLTPQQLDANRANIRKRGEEVGFQFGERARVWNTFDAHRLLHWAGGQGRQRELKHALLRAYHGEGRNPGAKDVLLNLAGEVGLDVAAAEAVLASNSFSDEVRQAEAFWQRSGISAVPSVVINDRHLIQGGQPPEVFEQALRQIAAQETRQ